jgi:hypothetical protein
MDKGKGKGGGDKAGKSGGATRGDAGGATKPAEDGAGGGAGAKSATGEPEIANTDEALGDKVIDDMQGLNSGGSLDSGVHYAHNYRELCRRKGKPDKWKDDYDKGLAPASHWTRVGFMAWQLKPGKSASEGVRVWLAGLTIAECAATVFTAKTDAVRATIGDERFDALWGSPDKEPDKELLRLGQHDNASVREYTKNIGAAPGTKSKIGQRPARRGGLYYFYNHPHYLLKHPGGAWQGENALYLGVIDGRQKWSGFGAADVTEDELLDEMVSAYNLARDEDDEAKLRALAAENGGELPAEYDPATNAFDDKITMAKLLSAPAYTIGSTTRKGGFVEDSGEALDTEEVEKLKKP